MTGDELTTWLNTWSRRDAVWYAKRLAANDTLATNAHQAGPYIPKEFLFNVVPVLNRPDIQNPDYRLPLTIDSHGDQREVRAVWYNNRLFGGTRNEARITNFGGRSSALLDPENTGALAVFVFLIGQGGVTTEVRVWVARNASEEEAIEDRIGPVEPGRWLLWSPAHEIKPELFAASAQAKANCHLRPEDMPAGWRTGFPSGLEIIRKTIELRPATGLDVDRRIITRRNCEYEVFLSVEEVNELPRIRSGFADIEEFIARAQTILQRRKSRSGKSLELHTREILLEEGFVEGTMFSHQPESDPGKKPDFLFPSQDAYKNTDFPAESLRMLAVKTTCKDRWRQILTEANRVATKHLLTLQEGVSENQFREMTAEGVRLVVPRELHDSYPESVRPRLLSLEAFIRDVQRLPRPAKT